MRKGIVSALLAVLVWACWGLAQNPAPAVADLPLPPSDPHLPMPPCPPVPQMPAQIDVPSPAAPAGAKTQPAAARNTMVAQSIPVKHPYLDLPPLPAVPPPLPLPESITNTPAARIDLPETRTSVPAPPIPSGRDLPAPDPVHPASFTSTTPLPSVPLTGRLNDPGMLPRLPATGGLPQINVVQETPPVPPPNSPPGPLPAWNVPPFWSTDGQGFDYRQYPAVEIVDAPPRFWSRLEYLLWFYKSGTAPPLVASVAAADANLQLDPSRADFLFPKCDFNDGPASGLRGTFGMWIDQDHRWGAEGVYFWLPETANSETFLSSPSRVIGRPFYNIVWNAPAFLPLSRPGLVNGSSQVDTAIDLQGGEINLLRRHGRELWFDIDFLAGFRYLGMTERLRVTDRWVAPSLNARMDSFDLFETTNDFFGGQVGVKVAYTAERWTADLAIKLAYGAMNQYINVDGATRGSWPGQPNVVQTGGTLAAVTNLGEYSRTVGAWVPEMTLNVGYRVTPNVVAFFGYNFLCISDVVRPGRQIDPVVNPDVLPFTTPTGASNALRPDITGRSDSFWAQGFNFGVAVNY